MATTMPDSNDLSVWLAWLEQLHIKNIDLSLERVRAVAQTLRLTEFLCPVIIIGGTNGKGSTVAILEAIYRNAGYNVGAYTSPHLLHFNERIRINGQDIDDLSIITALRVIEAARGSVTLTFFEYTTLVALWLFKQANLNIILLEVGLGGRLDAVNIIDADVSIVTSVDLDHMDWLGNTREHIGFEKAGIFRAGKAAICGDYRPPQTLIDHARHINAPLFCQNKAFHFNSDDSRSSWNWQGPLLHFNALPMPHLAMQNVSTALMAYHCLADKLPATEPQIREAIATTKVKGRFQQISASPCVIVDVAHNPAAAKMLAENIRHHLSAYKNITAVFSALQDKDIIGIIKPLSTRINAWYLAPLACPRGSNITDLMSAVMAGGGVNLYAFDKINVAYEEALLHSTADDCIIVFGSFYTVAEILIDTHGA